MNLTAIFGKFAGREIRMTEKEVDLGFAKVPTVELANPRDPLIMHMRKAADDNGLRLRLFWPGVMGTTDVRHDRVTVNIVKGSDGKWRIANDFRIG